MEGRDAQARWRRRDLPAPRLARPRSDQGTPDKIVRHIMHHKLSSKPRSHIAFFESLARVTTRLTVSGGNASWAPMRPRSAASVPSHHFFTASHRISSQPQVEWLDNHDASQCHWGCSTPIPFCPLEMHNIDPSPCRHPRVTYGSMLSVYRKTT